MSQHRTRERLIEAAIELLWERGFHATGVDELCMRADARKGSFYHFFASKADLAAAAVQARWSTLRANVFQVIGQTGAPGLDRLRRLIHATAELQASVVTRQHVVLGSPFGGLAQETAHRDERLRRAVLEVYDEQCLIIQAWIDEAVLAGEVPKGDTLARARNVLALLEGALLLAKVADDVELFRAVAEAGVTPLVSRDR